MSQPPRHAPLQSYLESVVIGVVQKTIRLEDVHGTIVLDVRTALVKVLDLAARAGVEAGTRAVTKKVVEIAEGALRDGLTAGVEKVLDWLRPGQAPGPNEKQAEMGKRFMNFGKDK